MMMKTPDSHWEDEWVEFMVANNEHLQTIVNNSQSHTLPKHFNLNCLNDVASVDYFINKNIGMNYSPVLIGSTSTSSAMSDLIDASSTSMSSARTEIFHLFNTYKELSNHHIIVKGIITDASDRSVAIVNIEQVFLVSEFDTRLYKIESMQMLGLLNLKATLHSSDCDRSSNVVFNSSDSIYALIINIDEDKNTISLSSNNSILLDKKFHICTKTDIKFRLGLCRLSDLQESITYSDEKQRRRVLSNRLVDMIEDQPTFRNPYIIQSLTSEKYGIGQFESLIPPKYTYRDKINVARDNYKQIRTQQNKQFAQKNVLEGVKCAKSEDYDKAIHYYDKALQFDPENDHAYVGKGAAYLKQNKMAEATTQFEKALEINPENKPAQSYLETTRDSANQMVLDQTNDSTVPAVKPEQSIPAPEVLLEKPPVEDDEHFRKKIEADREHKERRSEREKPRQKEGRKESGKKHYKERRDKKRSRSNRDSGYSDESDNEERRKRRKDNRPHHRDHSPRSPRGHTNISPVVSYSIPRAPSPDTHRSRRHDRDDRREHRETRYKDRHPNRDNLDYHDKRDKDSRDNRDSRDNKDGRDQRDTRSSRDSKEHRDNRDNRESRENRDTRDNREHRDHRASRDNRDRDHRESRITPPRFNQPPPPPPPPAPPVEPDRSQVESRYSPDMHVRRSDSSRRQHSSDYRDERRERRHDDRRDDYGPPQHENRKDYGRRRESGRGERGDRGHYTNRDDKEPDRRQPSPAYDHRDNYDDRRGYNDDTHQRHSRDNRGSTRDEHWRNNYNSRDQQPQQQQQQHYSDSHHRRDHRGSSSRHHNR